MNQLLSIVEDKLVIEKLRLKYLEGNVLHVGNLDVAGAVNVKQTLKVDNNLNVKGIIEADTIKVKNLITEDATQTDAFTFSADDAKKLDGKGLMWGLTDSTHQFVFKADPRRIFSSESIDLNRNARYQIDGMDVILKDRLGNTIQHSNLTSVGVLTSLDVEGNTNLGNTLFVNSYLNRIGINSEKPNAAFSVTDNNVEVILGSDNNAGIIGTWGAQGLNIVTDNTTRISIHGNNITFGSEKGKNAVVKINGTLEVDSIVSDVRVQRTTPIEFLEDADSGVYGKGLAWKGKKTVTKQLTLVPNPDRFFSTETIDLADGKVLSIGNSEVLSKTGLGTSVQYSNLRTVGALEGLVVDGDVNINNTLSINGTSVKVAQRISVVNGETILTVSSQDIETTSDTFKIKLQETTEFGITDNNIAIGNKNNTSRVVNVYGRVSVNTTNPHPDAAFEINGAAVFSGKKFTNGEAIPTSGNWNKGDIVWNINPQETSYIGWVCVTSGTPGQWKPFGYIGER